MLATFSSMVREGSPALDPRECTDMAYDDALRVERRNRAAEKERARKGRNQRRRRREMNETHGAGERSKKKKEREERNAHIYIDGSRSGCRCVSLPPLRVQSDPVRPVPPPLRSLAARGQERRAVGPSLGTVGYSLPLRCCRVVPSITCSSHSRFDEKGPAFA